MPGGSFPPFPPTTSATAKPTKQRHQKSSSSSASHSPHSDSVLFLHTSVNSTKQQEQQRQRPVSVPPSIGPCVFAEFDGTEGGAATAADTMNFLSEKGSTTPAMSALLGRQPTITEDEENEREEDEEPISMPDFGAAVTRIVSDFGGGRVKSEAHEEVIMMEDDVVRHQQQQMPRFAGKSIGDGGECRDGSAEGAAASMHLKREEEDAAGAEQQRQREEAEDAADLGAAALKARRAARQRKREPVVVGWRTLEKAMRTTAEDSDMSPLEQFLLGSTLLSRLCSFFEMAFAEAQRQQRGKFKLPIKDYGVGTDGVMSATFPSYPMPPSLASSSLPNALGSPGDHSVHQQFHPSTHCMVRLQLFVCPQQFRLVAMLDYATGPQCPAESDVRIFERFFAREVVRMNNELAVFAFVTLCRFCHPPIFASFAQLMMAQMEPQPRWPWRVELELVHNAEESSQPTGANSHQQQQQQKTQKIVKNSIQVPDLCKRFVFVIWLRPQWQNGANCQWQPTQQQQHGGTKRTAAQAQTNGGERRVALRYEIDLDELTLPPNLQQQRMSPEESQAIEAVLKAQGELCRQQSVADPSKQQQRRTCCIWPCIRALLEGQHQQQRQPNPQLQVLPMGMQQIQGNVM
ncbi:hypothetical protein niasHT_016844 [Heterodera trifolii]|uniref:Uncharacterized protein n=1 Tax=Heterodera trifolii TaxID=157864 RepID=A0ABD2KT91_9BILA